MSLPNVWHHRRVADASARPCWICFKPASSVLITPDNKDFFYICLGHLKDRSFSSPIVDEADVAAKKQAALDAEVARLKEEFEAKKKLKKDKDKEKATKQEKGNDKKGKDDEGTNAEKEDKVSSAENKKSDETARSASSDAEESRIYALQK